MEKGSKRSEDYADRIRPREALDRRYGDIGISAVAAAVRYQGETKTTRPHDDD